MIGKAIDMRLATESMYSTEGEGDKPGFFKTILDAIVKFFNWCWERIKALGKWFKGLWDSIRGKKKEVASKVKEAENGTTPEVKADAAAKVGTITQATIDKIEAPEMNPAESGDSTTIKPLPFNPRQASGAALLTGLRANQDPKTNLAAAAAFAMGSLIKISDVADMTIKDANDLIASSGFVSGGGNVSSTTPEVKHEYTRTKRELKAAAENPATPEPVEQKELIKIIADYDSRTEYFREELYKAYKNTDKNRSCTEYVKQVINKVSSGGFEDNQTYLVSLKQLDQAEHRMAKITFFLEKQAKAVEKFGNNHPDFKKAMEKLQFARKCGANINALINQIQVVNGAIGQLDLIEVNIASNYVKSLEELKNDARHG